MVGPSSSREVGSAGLKTGTSANTVTRFPFPSKSINISATSSGGGAYSDYRSSNSQISPSQNARNFYNSDGGTSSLNTPHSAALSPVVLSSQPTFVDGTESQYGRTVK